MLSLSKSERWFLIILFVISFGLRFFYLTEIRSNPFFEHPRLDALYHDIWAQSIAGGNWLGNEVFFRAPFYPYFLGVIYLIFGHGYLMSRIIQHILGISAVFLLYLLARRLFGTRTAVLASLWMTTYAILIYFEAELLFDSMLVFLCVLLFLMIYRWKFILKPLPWFATGLLFGTICITRPIFLPFIAVVVTHFIISNRKFSRWTTIVKPAIYLLIGMVLIIIPVTVRNYVVGKDFVLIASQGGINFFIGNNEMANGFSSAIPGQLGVFWENRDIDYQVRRDLGEGARPSEVSNYWYQKGIEAIKKNPGHFINLLVKKSYLFWNWYEIGNNQSFYSFQKYSSLLYLLPTGFWIIGPLGLLGMGMAWRNKRGRLAVIFVIYSMLITIAFFVCDRYRLPVIPFLCMFSAYACVLLYDKIRTKSFRSIIYFFPLLLLFFLFTNSNIYKLGKENPTQEVFRLGVLELQNGNYGKAISYFEECEKAGSVIPNLNLNLGVCELMEGKTDIAIKDFHTELRYFPFSYGALTNLAYVYNGNHQFDSVKYYAELAIKEKPYASGAYIQLAHSYLTDNKPGTAEVTLREGKTKCGKDFLYGQFLLAGSLLTQNKIREAEVEYRLILSQLKINNQPLYEPDVDFSFESKLGENPSALYAKTLYGLGHIFVSQNNLDSAISYFRGATKLKPDFADAWVDLGIALHRTNRLPEADTAFARGIGLNPKNYLYWYGYGLLLTDMNRTAEAINAFENSLSIRPDFQPASNVLSLLRKK